MELIAFIFVVSHITLILAGQNETLGLYQNVRYRCAALDAPTSLLNEQECTIFISFVREDTDDLFILRCIQTLHSAQLESLSDGCQHLIWRHTRKILADESVFRMTREACSKDTASFVNCLPAKSSVGVYLACLVVQLENAKPTAQCRTLIHRLKRIAFTVYRLLGKFLEDYEEGVERLGCGRLNADREIVSQGETIACLQEKVTDLKAACKKQVLHVSEQQSDDLKLNRKFYMSCRTDAIRFCPNAPPGKNAVYKCLVRHKDSAAMTGKCREQVVRRDKLLAHDYRFSRSLH